MKRLETLGVLCSLFLQKALWFWSILGFSLSHGQLVQTKGQRHSFKKATSTKPRSFAPPEQDSELYMSKSLPDRQPVTGGHVLYADVCVNTAHWSLCRGEVTEVVTGVSVQAHGVCEMSLSCKYIYVCLCALTCVCLCECCHMEDGTWGWRAYPDSLPGGRCSPIPRPAHIQSLTRAEMQMSRLISFAI